MDKITEQIERNGRVQDRYDELMHEGKHGHYETLFRVVNEEIERYRQAALNAKPADDIMRTIQNVPAFNMNGYGDDDVRRLHDWAVSVVHCLGIDAQPAQPAGETLDERGMFCGECQNWDGKHADDCSRR